MVLFSQNLGKARLRKAKRNEKEVTLVFFLNFLVTSGNVTWSNPGLQDTSEIGSEPTLDSKLKLLIVSSITSKYPLMLRQ